MLNWPANGSSVVPDLHGQAIYEPARHRRSNTCPLPLVNELTVCSRLNVYTDNDTRSTRDEKDRMSMSNIYVHKNQSLSVRDEKDLVSMCNLYAHRDHSRSVRDEKDRVSMSKLYVHRDNSLSVRDEKDRVTMENINYMSPETTSNLSGTKKTCLLSL